MIVFHALAAQDEALTTEPKMKKQACFLPACALISGLSCPLLSRAKIRGCKVGRSVGLGPEL